MSRSFQTTPVFDTYWRFAFERQEIFFRRLRGDVAPWTSDSILREHKFTNVYRSTDRVSQFLIRDVIYDSKYSQANDEVMFRILLFKFFNKIETWKSIVDAIGAPTWCDFDFETYAKILDRLMVENQRIYSAAYIMPPAFRNEPRKHRTHLRLLEMMMRDHLTNKLEQTPSMKHAFELLRSYSGIGDFLAYQFAIDINYSNVTNFSENDFTIAGPGARDGIRKCFTDLAGRSETDVIHFMIETQDEQFARLKLPFQNLFSRPLHLIDAQNIFCEVSKYSRVAHPDVAGISNRTRIKQTFHSNGTIEPLFFPPKWNIESIATTA